MQKKQLEGNALEVREKSIDLLRKDGGFNLIKGLSNDLQYFSPNGDEDLKEEFLDPEIEDFEEAREELRNTMDVLIDLLQSSESLEDLSAKAQEKASEAVELRNQNLKKIVDKTRPLEKSYRELDLYFKNAGPGKVKNLVILNVDKEALLDPDDEVVYPKVQEILSEPALAIDQTEVFSFLVIPEFLGEGLIQTYTGIAHEYKVLFLSDHKDLKSVDDVVAYRNSKRGEKIGGVQAEWSHASLFTNYVMLRDKYGELGEKDGLFGSPSIAAAGKLYTSKISQPAAGVEFGEIKNSMALKFKVNQPQVTELAKAGLNPMVNAFSQNMPFNATTLFSGANTELKHYAVVRTFDYIDKTLKHFLNMNVHAVLDVEKANKIHKRIIDFLEELKEMKIIEKGLITRFERDKRQPDKINIDFEITPLWATRTFFYKLGVAKGEDANSEIS